MHVYAIVRIVFLVQMLKFSHTSLGLAWRHHIHLEFTSFLLGAWGSASIGLELYGKYDMINKEAMMRKAGIYYNGEANEIFRTVGS